MAELTVGRCKQCGALFNIDSSTATHATILALCRCGEQTLLEAPPALVNRATARPSKDGPSARKLIRFVGSFLYGLILGAIIVSYPSLEIGNYEAAATSYISFLIAICKLATVLVALACFLAGLYWGYRLSADGNSALMAFGLPLLVFTMTVLPFATTLREYSFSFSSIFLYFLLGVTGTTVVFCVLIIMLVSTDAVIFRLGRVLSVMPFIIFTTLWLTALGQATVLYLLASHALWLKIIVGFCNLGVALFLLVIPAGASFFISD